MHVRTAILTLLLTAASLGTVTAQATRSTRDGVYNQAQALRGREIYADKCANCHGRALNGEGENGPVAGEKFRGEWEGENLLTFFDRVKKTMPYKTPDSMSRQETADVVAFPALFQRLPGRGERIEHEGRVPEPDRDSGRTALTATDGKSRGPRRRGTANP